MKIEIKNRFTDEIIIADEYNSILDAVEKNGADLRDADLRDADLRYADLRDADLRYADLRDADLRNADLRDADLRYADLRDADLRYADLRDADLRYADLRYADLRYADLRDADLRDAKNIKFPIATIYGTVHAVFAMDGKIKIGCVEQTVEEWILNYREIGEENDYTDEQIVEYKKYIDVIKILFEKQEVV